MNISEAISTQSLLKHLVKKRYTVHQLPEAERAVLLAAISSLADRSSDRLGAGVRGAQAVDQIMAPIYRTRTPTRITGTG